MDILTEQILVGIIKREMSLGDNNVWVRDQNRKIPADNGVYVVVGMADGKVISTVNEFEPVIDEAGRVCPFPTFRIEDGGDFRIDAEGDPRTSAEEELFDRITAEGDARTCPVENLLALKEINQVVMLENIQIDIFSRGVEGLRRRWEVVAALNSLYSKQAQETNSFKIFRIPSTFVNSSTSEGGSNLNRFTMILATHVWYRKEKVLSSSGDYYDDFTQRVDDEVSIGTPTGIIEFEISAESGVT